MESPRSVSSVESRSKVPSSIANLGREELEKTVQNLLRKLKQRDREVKDYEKRLGSVTEGESDALDSQHASLLNEKASLQESCTSLTQERDAAQLYAQDLSKRLEQLTMKVDACESAIKLAEEEKTGLARKLREVQDEDQALHQQVETLKQAIGETVEERDASFSRLAEERDRRMEMESVLSTAQGQLREMHQETENLKKDQKELELLRKQRIDLQQDSNLKIESLKAEAEKTQHRSEERLTDLRDQLKQTEEDAAEWQRQKEEVSNQNATLQERLEARQKMEGEWNAATQRAEELETELKLLKSRDQEDGKCKSVPAELATELESRIEKHKVRISELEEALASAQTRLTEEEQQKHELQLASEKHTTEFEHVRSKLGEDLERSRAEVEERTANLQSAFKEKNEQKAIVEQLNADLAAAKEEVVSLKDKCRILTEASAELDGFRKQNEELLAQLQHLSSLHKQSELLNESLTEKEVSLKSALSDAEQRLRTLEQEAATAREVHEQKVKDLQAELKKVQKGQFTAGDRVQELDGELTQLKDSLSRSVSKLDEETQAHRITRQRLNDEQETAQQLKKQLQDALAKMQTSEVETWKQQETIAAQQKETEEIHLKKQEQLTAELMELKNRIQTQEQQIAGHEEEVEKVKENAESEKEKLKRAIVELKKRLDRSSAQLKKLELEATETQNSHYTEKEQIEAQVLHHQHQAEKLSNELRDYRAKAHLLVKTKEQELNAAKADLQHRADLEVDVKVLREKFDDLTAERDNLKEELTQANERFQVHLDDLVADFQGQINEKTTSVLHVQLQNEELERSLHETKTKADELEIELHTKTQELTNLSETQRSVMEVAPEKDSEKRQIQLLEQELRRVKEEFSAYKRTAEQMAEVQQVEMSRLIQSNLELRRYATEEHRDPLSPACLSMDQQSTTRDAAANVDNFQLSDLLHGHNAERPSRLEDGESLSESQIVALANKQAEREDTFHVLKRQNDQMLSEIEELEKELELHRQQEAVLKEYLREADDLKKQLKSQPPGDMDFQYLKNTVMKLITTGESETLLPVFAKLLSFTNDESKTLMTSIQASKKNDDASGSGGLLSSWTGLTW